MAKNAPNAPSIDSLLEPILHPASKESADQLLADLITLHAEPLIKGIIRYKLHLSAFNATQQAEIEDLYQDVLVKLLTELDRLREDPVQHPIEDVRGLAAIIAHRTCSGWLRRRFPERHAFKSRLYYLLTRQKGFALWRDDVGTLLAGFSSWRASDVQASSRSLTQVAEDNLLLSRIESHREAERHGSAEMLSEIFNHVGSPVEFEELVSVLANIWHIKVQPLESTDEGEHEAALASAGGQADTSWQVEKRMFLVRLWEELGELPANQRAALLLNLRDQQGRGCIALFPATGVATVRQLADVLNIPAERFVDLWNELPLEDSRIAELCGLTRQQVINARKSGRERLSRRLKGFI
ncbi:MAG TPA: hypothetical protein VKM94_02055 [Blastocatellia bacterium]|nr:hypothetical protein [Blastocatellia bacterium]